MHLLNVCSEAQVMALIVNVEVYIYLFLVSFAQALFVLAPWRVKESVFWQH